MGRLPWRAHFAAALLVVCMASLTMGFSQEPADAAVADQDASIAASSVVPPQTPKERYGLWVLAPPVVTIVLGIAFRSVIPALSIGVVIAGYMMIPCLPEGDAYGGGWLGGLRLAVESYLIKAITDPDHASILVFSLTIAGMVGVIASNGGTAAVVRWLSRYASNSRRGQVCTWFAGLLVFFDDYANAMIVGPSMRPVADRLRISRAKLAYIVDSTAAPVSSIALIGTWIGAEVGYIQNGLDSLTQRPGFLENATAYEVFLSSLAYRFYAVLALVMVLWIALFRRDFGPMLRAEREAAENRDGVDRTATTGDRAETGYAWFAVVPVAVLVILTLIVLFETGRAAVGDASDMPWGRYFQDVISNANAYSSILYGAVGSAFAAVVISVTAARQRLSEVIDSATLAMGRVFPTFVVLVLAWALSAGVNDLQLGEVAVEWLKHKQDSAMFDVRMLPFLIFAAACVVSFAMGSSWGTMGILCPSAVTISAGLLGDMPASDAQVLFYASVGAVLAGAIFGDHCSPISDTTVLSSLATECRLEQHVWTQMPYAVVVMLVSVVAGDYLVHYMDQPWWVGLLVGSAMLALIVWLVGRPVEPCLR